MANVRVFAETRGDALRKVALEAVTAARALADSSGGGEVHALAAHLEEHVVEQRALVDAEHLAVDPAGGYWP